MMDKHNIKIEAQIERFLAGATNHAEERKLYDFFAGNDIPQHLLPYKELFAWFDVGLEREKKESPVTVPPRPRNRFRIWGTVAAVAATITILLLLRPVPAVHEIDFYEESYIVRDGVIITDREIVNAELEAVEARWEKEEKRQEALLLYQMLKVEIDYLLQEYQLYQDISEMRQIPETITYK